MSEANKGLVRAYFAALDRRDTAAAATFFAPDAVVHRTDLRAPISGPGGMQEFFRRTRPTYSAFRTEIDDLLAEGDRVVARIRHFVTFESDWVSPIGPVAAAGKSGSWTASATFRIEGDRIVEQWVVRDDLHLLQDIGAIARPA